jgi:hypothetical protein
VALKSNAIRKGDFAAARRWFPAKSRATAATIAVGAANLNPLATEEALSEFAPKLIGR